MRGSLRLFKYLLMVLGAIFLLLFIPVAVFLDDGEFEAKIVAASEISDEKK